MWTAVEDKSKRKGCKKAGIYRALLREHSRQVFLIMNNAEF